MKRPSIRKTQQRQKLNRSDRLHLREFFDAIAYLLDHIRASRGIAGNEHFHRQDMFWPEAEFDSKDMRKGANKEPSAYEQDYGQCYFCNYQRAAESLLATVTRSSPTAFQSSLQIEPRELPCWRQSERGTCEQ
jgi:hypothetical protein